MKIAEIRKQFPEYADVSDLDLATALHKKDYADVDFNDFAKAIGLKEQTATVADYGRAGMSGVAGVVEGAGKGVGFVARAATPDLPQPAGFEQFKSTDLEDAGKWLQNAGGEAAQSWVGWMTPAGQQASKNQIFNDDLSLGKTPWQSLGIQAVMSLPSMAAMIPIGGPAASAITAAGGKTLMELAKRPGTIGFIARTMPSAVGYGGAEGMVAALQNAAQTEREILDTPVEKLQKHPNFQRMLAEADPSMPLAKRQELARQATARLASDEVAWKTFASTGGIGILTGGGALGFVARAKPGDGFLKTVAKGSREEAFQEAPQSAAEQYIQNVVDRAYVDPEKDPMQGVAAAAAGGAAVGAFTGGVFGAGGALMRRDEAEAAADVAKIIDAPTVDAAIAAAVAAVNAPPVDAVAPVTVATITPQEPVDAGLARVFNDPTYNGMPVSLAAQGFTENEVGILKDAGLADPAGSMTREQFSAYMQDREPQAAPTGLIDQAMADQAQAPRIDTPPVSIRPAETAALPAGPAIDPAAHEAATSEQNDLPEPTEAQKEAGNYKKGHVKVGGLDVSVENPAGTKRRPEWPTLEAHYGYVKGVAARAPDKEHVDVFVRQETPENHAGPVYVVDQANAKGSFDEPKVMVGFASEAEARATYLKNYTKGWESRVMGITPMTMEQFKAKLADPNGFMKPQVPGRTVITPDEDTAVGNNDAGEPLYERADGSRYRMHRGRPDFGGDLVPHEPQAANTKAKPKFEVGQRVKNERGDTGEVIKVGPSAMGVGVEVRWDRNKIVNLVDGADRPNDQLKDWQRLSVITDTPGAVAKADAKPDFAGVTVTEVQPAPYVFRMEGGKSAPVQSIGDAMDKWEAYRKATNGGASEIGNGGTVYDKDGNEVVRISYNGRAWSGDGTEWVRDPKLGVVSIPGRDPDEGPALSVDMASGTVDVKPAPAKREEKDVTGTAPEHRAKDGDGPSIAGKPVSEMRTSSLELAAGTGNAEVKATAMAELAKRGIVIGATDKEVAEVAELMDSSVEAQTDDDFQVTHVFDPPTKDEVVRTANKTKVYNEKHGWMTVDEAKAKIAEWKAHAKKQGETTDNSDKVVLSLFDLTGAWSKPWAEAGYDVYRFDIQDDPEVGNVENFSTEFFNDWFGSFEGRDIYAILAACPCTDFAVSGARHFAAKDADGRTIRSVELVNQTRATIEYFKPAVWALENPVGRIEKLTGLQPWRLSFDPNHFGEPYTKKTLLWGRFNADLPIAPVEPTEGSKMWSQFGGKSQATKNARSATPEGFAYSFFMANNAIDNPVMAISNQWDRLDAKLIKQAVEAGVTADQIKEAVEDFYYQELDDAAANNAIQELIDGPGSLEGQPAAKADEKVKLKEPPKRRGKKAQDPTSDMFDQPAQSAAAPAEPAENDQTKRLRQILESMKKNEGFIAEYGERIQSVIAHIESGNKDEFLGNKLRNLSRDTLRQFPALSDIFDEIEQSLFPAKVEPAAADAASVSADDFDALINEVQSERKQEAKPALKPTPMEKVPPGGWSEADKVPKKEREARKEPTAEPANPMVKAADALIEAANAMKAAVEPAKAQPPKAAEQAPENTADRPKDDDGNPIYKKGERVEFTSGRYEGRHGEISVASAYTMRTIMVFGGAQRDSRTSYMYQVRTDNGAEVSASVGEFQIEGTKPETVTPDIKIGNQWVQPDVVYRQYQGYVSSANNLRARAGRARKDESKRSALSEAARSDENAKIYRKAFDDWAAQYPADAEKIRPATAQAKSTAPATTESKDGLPGMTVVETKHTKTGEKLWVVNMNKREEYSVFKAMEERAKQFGGYYNRSRAGMKGYTFKKEIEARQFMGVGEPAEMQAGPTIRGRDVQLQGSPYVYRKEPNGRWTWRVGFDADPARANALEPDAQIIAEQLEPALRAETEKNNPGKTAGDLAGDVAKSAAAGVKEGFAGLDALFGRKGTLGSGPAFDEETWAKAKPHFEAAYAEFVAAGKSLKAFVKHILDSYNEAIIPYLKRWHQEVSNAVPERQEAAGNDRRSDEGERAGTALPSETGESTERVRPDEGISGDPAVQRADEPGIGGRHEAGTVGAERGLFADSPGVDATAETDRGNGAGASTGVPDGTAGGNYLAPVGSLARQGSWLDTAKRNVQIIKLVKTLEAEARLATPQEQSLISLYTGFGASEIANGLFPVKYEYVYGRGKTQKKATGEVDEDALKPGWKELFRELQGILDAKELATLTRSTQYAHYTAEPVIRSIWNAVTAMGFPGGKILEPGMGTGLFMVAAPENVAQNSKYIGVEMDHMTASIAKQLLQKQNIIQDSFIDHNFPDNFFDMAIGNPPFAGWQVLADPRYRKQGFLLHDYFFAKTIDRVRPGGLLVFVTSAGTMNKLDDKAREFIAERADLLGAIRLPQTAFKQSAGTEVVTDILFLQKRQPGQERGGEAWNKVDQVDVTDEDNQPAKVGVNEYFVAHPEMVLGTHSAAGSMYRSNSYTVLPLEGDIEAHFAKAAEKLPKDVYTKAQPKKNAAAIQEATDREDFDTKKTKEGGLYLADDGVVMQVRSGVGVPLTSTMNLTDDEKAWLKDYIPLRDALKTAQLDQLQDGPWEVSQKALQKLYKAFVKKHGRILAHTITEREKTDEDGEVTVSRQKRFKRSKLLKSTVDVEITLAMGLEKIGEDSTDIADGDILSTRVLNKPGIPRVETAQDALAATLNEKGTLDLDEVARLIGREPEAVIKELGDLIYEDPGAGWQQADEYLSGNVVRKLEEARAAAETDSRFERNVTALLNVQPKPLGPADFEVRLGANWIPAADVQAFTAEAMDGEIGIDYDIRTNIWTVEGDNLRRERTAGAAWGSVDRSAAEILSSVLNNKDLTVRKTGYDKKTFVDKDATAKVTDIAEKMREAFKGWIWTDADRAKRLLEDYNRRYNNLAPRQFDSSFLTLPGLSMRWKPYAHQLRAIWRIMQTGNTYMAHAVGAGKTMASIISAMEQKRLGMIRRPMFVVPNHMLEQFANEFMEFYPAAKILVADKENFIGDERRRFVAKASLGDWDAIIIKQSSFTLIGTEKDTREELADDFLADLQAALDDVDSSDRTTRKRLEAQIESFKQRVEKAGGGDANVTFEKMGVDFLYVDEAHTYRKLDYTTNNQIKGIDPMGSLRAFDMFVKLRHLDRLRPGRSVVMMSGTPITNTMAELYTVQRYMNYNGLVNAGLNHFDAWATTFGAATTEWDRDAAGNYQAVTRFAKFVNLPELMMMVRDFMDVLTMEQLGERVDRPIMKTGKPQMMTAPKSAMLEEYMKGELALRLEISKKWKPSKEEPGNPDPILNIITDGRLAAIDMRFVRPGLKDDKGSKLNLMIDKIVEDYEAIKDKEFTDKEGNPDKIKGASQIVFSALGFGEQVAKSRGFDAKEWVIKRLGQAGIPRSAIAFMGDYKTDVQKEAMFREMRDGKKRILIGSPQNMGTGLNVQKRLASLHFLAPPWYPADVEQPHGRILRQGNQNTEADIRWYVTEGTYDSTQWGMVRRKGTMIEQAFRGDKSIRTIEDLSEVGMYAMAEAVASGDNRVIQLAGLKAEIERFERLRNAHFGDQQVLKQKKYYAEGKLKLAREKLAEAEKALEVLGEYHSWSPATVEIDGKTFTKPGESGKALIARLKDILNQDSDYEGTRKKFIVGKIEGHDIVAEYRPAERKDPPTVGVSVKIGPMSPVVLWQQGGKDLDGLDDVSTGQKLRHALDAPSKQESESKDTIAESERIIKQTGSRIGTPFEYANNLAQAIADAAQLERDLTQADKKAAEELKDGQPEADEGPDADDDATRFSRAAPETVTVKTARNGIPVFGNSVVSIDRPRRYSEDKESIAYSIFDPAKVRAARAAGRSDMTGKVGIAELDVSPDGIIRGLSGIFIDAELRTPRRDNQGLERLGYGEKVIRAILSTLPDGVELKIHGILPEARGFWEKMGVRIEPGKFTEDGYVTRRDYEQKRTPIQDGGGTSSLVFSRGNGNEAPAVGVREGRNRRGLQDNGLDQVSAFRPPQSPATAGLSVSRIREALLPILDRWENAPEVKILPSIVHAPQAVRDLDAQQRAGGATTDPEAVIHNGKVYLFANALGSVNRAKTAMFHEVLGHYGLRGTFGNDLDNILKMLVSAQRSVVERKARQYGFDTSKASDMLEAAEEVLAELAQTRPESSFVQRAIAAIRKFLRDIGFDIKLSDNDIINDFILPARRFVEGSRQPGQILSPQPAASRKPSLRQILKKHGEEVANRIDAERRFNAGDRIFIAHELDETPFEAKNITDLEGYQADQMIAVPRDVMFARGGATRKGGFKNLTIDKAENLSTAELRQAVEYFRNAADTDARGTGFKSDDQIMLDALEEMLDGRSDREPTTAVMEQAVAKVGDAAFQQHVADHMEQFKDEDMEPAEIAAEVEGVARRIMEGAYDKPVQTNTEAFRDLTSLLGSAASARDVMSVSNKSIKNGLQGHAEALSNFFESEASLAQGNRLRNIPSPVVSHVVGVARSDDKILGVIVRSFPVDVVDFLTRKQISAEQLLRDKAMLENVLPINRAANVPLSIDESAAVSLVRSVARTAAKISTVLTDGTLESGSADSAILDNTVLGGQDNLRYLSGLVDSKVDQTKTPAFLNWFKDSKVVDADGKPLRVYHSTNAAKDFSVFRVGKELGAHFGSADQAASFTERGSRERVLPVYLAIKNPLRLKDMGGFDGQHVAPQLFDLGWIDFAAMEKLISDGFAGKATREMQKIIRAAGYDGVVYLNRREGQDFFGKDGFSGDEIYDMTDQQLLDEFPDARDSYIAFKPEQIKSAVGNNGQFDPGNPDIRFSRAQREEGIPAGAAQILREFDSDKPLKAHPDYKAAKAGDPMAAVRLVRDLVSEPNLQAARDRFGDDVLYVPVMANEATGHNQIPNAMAMRYSDGAGGAVAPGIKQTNEAHHTGARPLERMSVRPVFDGPVKPGGRYVLVDDVSTMGGTFSELADHIRAGGGEVVGVVSIVNAARTGDNLSPDLRTVREIERRFGDAIEQLFNIKPAALTRAEAQYVLNFKDVDALRGSSTAAVAERRTRLDAKGISQGADRGVDKTSFSRGGIPSRHDFTRTASDFVHDLLTSDRKFGLWHRTLGTQQHKALVNAEFKPVYDETQAFISDSSRYANESADLAADLLPRIDSFKDFWKKSPSKADVNAAGNALMQGTLFGGGSPLDGRIWTDEELLTGIVDGKQMFQPITDAQIKLYRQALKAANHSLDEFAKSMIYRYARTHDVAFDRSQSLLDAAIEVTEELEKLAAQSSGAKAAEIDAAIAAIQDVHAKTKDLKDHGYFPAMRFGQFAVYVTEKDEETGDVRQIHFGLHDTQREANKEAREMAAKHPKATVTKGIVSQEKHRLFQGLSLDALETFAEHMDIDADPIIQGFLRAATSQRSTLKRQIHRTGLAGFTDDIPRALAAFVVSTARTISSNYHTANMLKAAQDIRAGDVQDEAVKLVRYLMDPQEEAAALRGFLFFNFIGGSIAHGMVNMTQPAMVTAPWLSQHTSYTDAVAELGKAMKSISKGAPLEKGLAAAMHRAQQEGIVAPQEIHQLRAEAGPSLAGKSLVMRKLTHLWGSIYAVTEAFNRQSTFIAAYRIGVNKKMADPYAFAVSAVNETQFVYNKGSRPNWARGPVGSVVMTFKQFSISYLELMKRLYDKKGPDGKADRKAFAIMVLTLLAAAGTEGLPFVEDIEDMIDTIGRWMGFATNSKKSIRQFAVKVLGEGMAEFALKGVSAGLPVDVSVRLGLQNLVPGTRMLLPGAKNKGADVAEVLGPVGQFLPVEGTQLGRAIDRLSKGDVFGATKAGAPVAIRNFLMGYDMIDTGEARDTAGRKIIDVNVGDGAAKMIGLQPSKVARASNRIGEVYTDIEMHTAKEAEIADKWARGIHDKDPDMVDAARQQLRDWNETNPELKIRITAQQIRSRVIQMKTSRDDRFVKRAPPEIRRDVRERLAP